MLYQLSSAVVPPFRVALHQIVEECGIRECRVDLEPAEGSMVLMNDEVLNPGPSAFFSSLLLSMFSSIKKGTSTLCRTSLDHLIKEFKGRQIDGVLLLR